VQDHEEIEKSGEKGHPMILNDFEYPAVFFLGCRSNFALITLGGERVPLPGQDQ
jgi:hypothetical protein